MAFQLKAGALVGVQVSPAFVDVKISPILAPAASRVPSAEHVKQDQFVTGAVVRSQV